MTRRRWQLVLVILSVAATALAAARTLAEAARDGDQHVAHGVTVGGADVGGLSRPDAIRKVLSSMRALPARKATFTVDGRSYVITGRQAGLAADVSGAVDRALRAGRHGSTLRRGVRWLRKNRIDHAEPVRLSTDRTMINRRISQVARQVKIAPRDWQLKITLGQVSVTGGRDGARLSGRDHLADKLDRVLRTGVRILPTTRTVKVKPARSKAQVLNATPVVVTVSKSMTKVRVFRLGRIVKTYRVAVGQPRYPTPEGLFHVQGMQRNPTWTVPRSDWAGALAGQVIPGGDPRNPLLARWIGFNGSVGFHGTPEVGSIGSAASHGCVRMRPADVIDLYERVRVGTPVLVA